MPTQRRSRFLGGLTSGATGRGFLAATLATTTFVVLGVATAALAAVGVAPSVAGAATRVPASPSSGCHPPGILAPGPTGPAGQTVDITVAHRKGFYILQIPASYHLPTPMPVVFDFHGYSEPASLQVTISQLGSYGATHGFITVTPGVDEPVPLWESTVGSVDLRFFGGVLAAVERTVCVDRNRVYATGYSNGAFMSSAIACQFAGQVAAVAPVAGIQNLPRCHPTRPVPVVAFHGTADPFVHFNGTPSEAAADLPAPNGSKAKLGQSDKSLLKKGSSIPQITAAWARRNRCAPAVHRRRIASDVTLHFYRCPHHAAVELYVVAGGGHAWPGSPGSAAISAVVGRTTFSISADAIMWRFFEQHPLTRSD